MYDLVVCDWLTGARLGQVRYGTLEWHEVLCDEGDWSATIAASSPAVDLFLPGRTLVYVHDTIARRILYAGIVWRVNRRAFSTVIEVSGSSLLSYFNRRVIRTAQTFSAIEQFQIAQSLITSMQAVVGGSLGLSVVRTPTNSGVVRTLTWAAHELATYGDALTKLAELESGFEFAITAAWNPDGSIAHTITLAYPRYGTDLPLVWVDGVDVVVDQTEDDRADYATWWRARGGGSEGAAPVVDIGPATQPIVIRGFPVLDTAVTYSELTTTAALTARGTADQRASQVETMSVALSAATRYPPGTWRVGDSVRMLSPPPSGLGLDGSAWWRIGAYSASIDENGQLVVTLDVDRARNTARPMLRPLDRLAGSRAETARRLAVVENTKS